MKSSREGDRRTCRGKIGMGVAVIKCCHSTDVVVVTAVHRQGWASNTWVQVGVPVVAACFPSVAVHMGMKVVTGRGVGVTLCGHKLNLLSSIN